jgi:hypothetical protein
MEKTTEAPPARKQKCSYIVARYGHTLHRIPYITNYTPCRQGKRDLFFKEITLDTSIRM